MKSNVHRSRRAVLLAATLSLAAASCLGNVQVRRIRSFADLKYGLPEQFVELGGVRLCYADMGKGDEVVVLLAPSLSQMSVWREVATSLSRRYRVITLDLPGAGKSDKPPRFRYHPETFARVVARLLDHLRVSSATLVGNSNGGGTALAFALKHPERTRRLVLLSPSGVAPLDAWKRRALRWLDSRTLRVSPEWARALFRAFGLFGQHNAHTDAFISDFVSLRFAEEEFRAWFRAQKRTLIGTTEFDVSARAKAISAPTLIVWGDRDRVLDRSLGERLRSAIKGAELVVLPGIGHMPEVEVPDAVVRLVDGFLARTHPSAATKVLVPKAAPPATTPPPASPARTPTADADDKDDKDDADDEAKDKKGTP
jgi:pimeloyl-ACP methyl ester carboxylesterase